MKILDKKTTTAQLPFERLIPAIKSMLVQGCHVPRRHSHPLSEKQEESATLLLMPAWQEKGYLGIKHVTIYPNNGKKGLPGLHSTYTLFDKNTGVPVAIIDGDVITVRRTAAASALAASYLARKNAERLVIVGAGNVATALAPAYASIRRITDVAIWNINQNKAKALADQLEQQGFHAYMTTNLEDAVIAADIVSCATLSNEPLLRRAWLRPGTHVDLIGSFQPSMREADDATFSDTSVFIDTDEALDKSGDLISPIAAGVFRRELVLATLEDLCRGHHFGRSSEDEITVYKAVGTASEDLAAAMLAYTSA